MSDNKTYKLKNIGKIITGKTPKTSNLDFFNGKYMFITPNDLHGTYRIIKTPRTLSDSGLKSIQNNTIDNTSILVGCIGDVGMVRMCFDKCATNQQINSITDIKDFCNPYYLYYYLSNKKELFKNIALSTVVPIIPKTIFQEIEVLLPNIETQQKIARTLSILDQKIENNHKINELLHKILELLYEQYFVRFDFLDENNKPYQTSGGKMKFSKELNRLIPNDFEVKTLGELITWISGSQPPKSCHIYEHKEGYIRFIQNRDYSSNDYVTYIPISKNNKICYQYDIMIDKYGEAGAVRFGLQGAYNVALSKISVLNQSMQEYIRSYLNSKPIKKYLSNACMASTRSSLNENHIYSLMLPMPPINLLQKYEKIAKNIITAIIKNNQSTQTLTALRDFLLPLLLTQQVKPK
ncbi:restriction endonuclease subunit S [Helicobacter pylori]|uniref:restriction endonuclease subunit S n=1 Tax=Helicobacter pylori TaxID=210 RepID=UPI000FDDBDF1|nr:restriction endonuclease subunit S [Helicobacter pylori]RVZ24361.1 restriction endonuclease subunit S [Helicobacter pylori]